MTAVREQFREPPIFLSGGRLALYSDGEWVAQSQDGKSWTTGVLDSRDLSALLQHLPAMYDDALHLFNSEASA